MFLPWLWVKEAFFGLFRNFKWNFSVLFSTVICLFLFAGCFSFILNAKYMAENVNGKVEIKIHLLDEQIKYSEIEEKIKSLGNVKEIRFISKDEAKEKAKKELGENGDLFDVVETNPLPASFVVKLKDNSKIESFVKDVKGLKIAEKIQYGEGFVQKIIDSTGLMIKFAYVIIATFAIVVVMVIFAAIKNNISIRMNEIRIKQLIGASDITIRIPFILESVFLTLLSGAIVYYTMYFAYPSLVGGAEEIIPYVSFLEPDILIKEMLWPLFALALITGLMGSLFSTYRNIKK